MFIFYRDFHKSLKNKSWDFNSVKVLEISLSLTEMCKFLIVFVGIASYAVEEMAHCQKITKLSKFAFLISFQL